MKPIERLFQTGRQFHRLPPPAVIQGTTQTEYCTLMLVYKQKRPGVGSLAKSLHCSTPAVSKTLRALEEKELIHRFVDPKDRRNTYVELTRKGEEQIAGTREGMREYADRIQARMGVEKIEQLADLLEEMYQTACQVNQEWKKDEE